MSKKLEFTSEFGFEDYFKELSNSVRRHPPRSLTRERLINKMLSLIQRSPRLYRPKGIPNDIYEEALQRTLIYISNNIDRYGHRINSIMTLVNCKLKFCILDIYRQQRRREIPFSSINKFHDFYAKDIPSLAEELAEYIHLDPNKTFESTHLRNRPDATFKYILIQRLNGFTFDEISKELEIPVPSLQSFYSRSAKRFLPELRKALS